MGNSAIEYIFNKYDLGVTVIGDVHGKSYEIETPWGRVIIFALYHPAAAIYNRKLLGELETDMANLARLL